MTNGNIISSVISLAIVFIFISGCINEDSERDKSSKTVTMNAKELYDDIIVEYNTTHYYFEYASLNDGDTLILEDVIKSLTYDSENNLTRVTFEYDDPIYKSDKTYSPAFQGDLTDSFKVGDRVQITVHIKHVKFKNESKSFDLELFEEQWVNVDYFYSNFYTSGGLKPLDQKLIIKI